MKLLADKDERFKGLFVKVSILVSIALVGLILNLVVSAIKKGFFTPQSAIYFVADSGQDIKIGMPVKLSGFKIGAVSKLELDDKAHAQVEMMIENRYLALLNEDAVVSMKKEGLIGDGSLEVKRGSEDRPHLNTHAIITFERGGGLEQIATDLRDRLYPSLDQINKLLKDVNDPQGDMRQILGNLRHFSEDIQGTNARINHILCEFDDRMTNDVRPTLQSVRKSAEGAEAIVVKLNEELPGLLKKADVSLDNVRQTTETLKTSIDNSAPHLSGLMGETRGLMSDTRNIVDSASTSWPLKNIMPLPEQGLIKMDSHD